MIKLFYGDDRVSAKNAIDKLLGLDYEILEGINIAESDLSSIFLGGTLFDVKRKILIKDLSENKTIFERLPDFFVTPHDIILLETKLDKRSATFKSIKHQIEIKEFKLPQNQNFNLVFDIYKTAKKDGKKAVTMLEQIESDQDPYMFLGLLTSQAIKDFAMKQGIKEKRVLAELSKTDILMKTTFSEQPFLPLKSFLLQVSLY